MADTPKQEASFDAGIAPFFNDLADAARTVALHHFRSPLDFERKQDLSPVTIADQTIERELRRRISIRFPDHGILGEEMGSTPGGRYTWYLDPIDGTKSFISGTPLFGTLIALSDDRESSIVAGMIDMPALAERWYGAAGARRSTASGSRSAQRRTSQTRRSRRPRRISSPRRTGSATTR